MLNLNSTIELDVKKFFRWWTKELSFLIPEKIKRMIVDRRGFLVIRPVDAFFELSYISNDQIESLPPLTRGDAAADQYRNLLAQDERLAKADVVLRLTGQQVILKELGLPSAAKDNLYQVAGYELDRYTPFKPDQVYYAVQPIKEVVNEPGQIRVNLMLTTRALLDELYQEVKALGCTPKWADFENTPNDLNHSGHYYNLLPPWLQEKTNRSAQLIHAGLFAAVVVLFTAALLLPLWFQSKNVALLEAKIQEVEPEAQKIKALQLKIDGIVEKNQKLIAEKQALPPVVAVLNALSQLMKDNTSLAYAQYSEGLLQIQGESPTAATLIAALEDSDYFADSRFVSPVTQDKASGMERFQISVKVTRPEADANADQEEADSEDDQEQTDESDETGSADQQDNEGAQNGQN